MFDARGWIHRGEVSDFRELNSIDAKSPSSLDCRVMEVGEDQFVGWSQFNIL